MRFSFWPQPSQDFNTMQQLGQHVETTDWDGIWLADHFMPNAEDTSAPWPEAWVTLGALAAVIPRIRLGTLVTGNTYRHPAILAKMAATLDHISGGRVVLGMGSGWQENEHAKYGIPFYDVKERLHRLAEACHVIQSLFTEESTTFAGEFYQLTDAPLVPKPVQSPLPLMIGGGGEKLTLKITAQYANEWNVWGTPETLIHKMKVLDEHCAKLSRDPADIQRSAVALLFLSEDQAYLDKMRAQKMAQPTIIGNSSEVKDIIGAYRDAGVDELIIPDFTMGLGATSQKKELLDKFMTEAAAEFK
jgi:F420-dependent oxidoreductase-like protein